MNWLDLIGALLSLICTYYFTKAERKAWILSVVAILFNIVLYWQNGIYGSVLLEGVYLITSFYGLYQWSFSKAATKVYPIRSIKITEVALLTFLGMVGVLLFSKALITWTDSTIPYWDAITTVFSLIAQWMLCFKILHCWFIWFAVDALMAIMQLYKGLPFHSALYWVYLIMAVLGFYRWRKIARTQQPIFA